MKKFFFILMSLTLCLSAISCSSDNDSEDFVSESTTSSNGAKKFVGYWDGYDDIVFDQAGRCCVNGSFGVWSYNTETSALSTIVGSSTNIWTIATIDEKSWTGSTSGGSSRGFTKMTEAEFISWIESVRSKLEDDNNKSLYNYIKGSYYDSYIYSNSTQSNITFNPNNEITYSFSYETDRYSNSKKIENAGTIKLVNPYDFQKMKVVFTGAIEGTFHFKSSNFVN